MKKIDFAVLRNSDARVSMLAKNLSSPSNEAARVFSPSLAAAGKMVTNEDDIFLAREELSEATSNDSSSDATEEDNDSQ